MTEFLVLCLTVSLLLRGIFIPFLLRLLQRLVYSENLLVLGDQDVLLRYFSSFIISGLEYHSPVYSSAADSYLKLFDKNPQACKF